MHRHDGAPPVAGAVPRAESTRPQVPRAAGPPLRRTARPTTPHAFRHRQAAAGNSAVARLVQRAAVVQRQPVTNDAEFGAAVGRHDWTPAVAYLANSTATVVSRLASSLDVAACEGLLGAVSATQHDVRGALLERGWQVTRGTDWPKAARFLSVLDTPGIARNLAGVSAPELKQLAKGARNTPGGGDDRLLEAVRGVLKAQPGELFGKVTVKMTPKNGLDTGWSLDPNQRYSCHVEITFDPDLDICEANRIAFVQTMSLLRTGTTDSKDDRKGISGRLNAKGQAVDRPRSYRSGYYQQEDDGTYHPQTADAGVEPGFATGGAKHPASMIDTPDGKLAETTWSYETSIVAQTGADAGLVYAVVLWTFTVDKKLNIASHSSTVQQKPTADFGAAVGAWNTQVATDATPKGQQALPVMRMADTAAVQRCGAEVHAGCLCAEESPAPAVQRDTTAVRDTTPGRDTTLVRDRTAARDTTPGRATAAGGRDRAAPPPVPVVQRDDGPFGQARKAFDDVVNRPALEAIQGLPMDALLARLAASPVSIRLDERNGRAVGGDRLVLAQRAAGAKGTPWEAFLTANNALLAGLPADQVAAVVAHLGGPKDGVYYPADQIKDPVYGGKFDGAVDPVAGSVTLYFRVRFVTDGVRWGHAPSGTPEAARENEAGRAKFEADFKKVVESTWSFKGKVKPACAIGPIAAFATKVVVTVVDSGEHTLFHVFSAFADGRSNASPGHGNLKAGDNEEHTGTKQVSDPTGKRPEQVTTTQAPSAHEFGHALGLHHPHCPGADDNCYGVTAEERQDIMGAGNMIQVMRRNGKVVHDDFAPFEAIAKTWGTDKLTGPLAACNTWSAV